MSKRTLIIAGIILAFILLIGGLIAWFYYATQEGDTPGGGGDTTDLFPFGGGGGDTPGGGGGDTTDQGDQVQQAPVFRQVSDTPVSGAIAVGATSTTFKYIERATGHVFEAHASTTARERISNTTIPRIQEGVWAPSGDYFIVRYLDDTRTIKTFSGRVTSGSVSGSFLEDDIQSLAIRPDGERILSVQPNSSGVSVVASDADGAAAVQVYTSPFSGWLPSWPEINSIFLQTKATGQANGSLYALNTGNGQLERVVGPYGGLTASVGPNGRFVLFAVGPERNQGFRTLVYDRETGEQTELALATLPEKCVWSNDTPGIAYCGVPLFTNAATYPDAWYQGDVAFTDAIWQVDATTGNVTQLFSPSENRQTEFDITEPILSAGDAYFLFTNRNTGILWALDLTRL